MVRRAAQRVIVQRCVLRAEAQFSEKTSEELPRAGELPS